MARKGSRSSASAPSTSRDSSCKQKTLIGGDAETIMLLLKDLTATTSKVVARLDSLEGTHFDARGPADFGATGSTTRRPLKLLNRLLRFVRPLRSVVPLAPRAPATCRPRSANRLHLQLQLIPRRRPLSTTSTSPLAARLFNCLNLERLILTVGLWRWRKTMTVAASSAVPSRLLLLTTRRPSSKYRHLFVGAQFGCGFEMSVDLKMFTSSSPKFYAV